MTDESFKNNKGILFFTAIIVLAVLFQFSDSYKYNKRRDTYIFEDFARNIFMSLEPNSILIAADDSIINPLWYLQSRGERNDVIVVSAGLLNYDWYVKSEIKKNPDIADAEVLSKKWDSNRISHILNKNINNKKVYTTFTAWDDYSNSTFDFVPAGSVYAVIPKGGKDKGDILQKNHVLWDQYVLRGIKYPQKDYAVNRLIQHYALSLNNAGAVSANLGYLEEAAYFLKKSIDIVPDPKTKENLERMELILRGNR